MSRRPVRGLEAKMATAPGPVDSSGGRCLSIGRKVLSAVGRMRVTTKSHSRIAGDMADTYRCRYGHGHERSAVVDGMSQVNFWPGHRCGSRGSAGRPRPVSVDKSLPRRSSQETGNLTRNDCESVDSTHFLYAHVSWRAKSPSVARVARQFHVASITSDSNGAS